MKLPLVGVIVRLIASGQLYDARAYATLPFIGPRLDSLRVIGGGDSPVILFFFFSETPAMSSKYRKNVYFDVGNIGRHCSLEDTVCTTDACRKDVTEGVLAREKFLHALFIAARDCAR